MFELAFCASLIAALAIIFPSAEYLITLFTVEEDECWDDFGATPDEVASFFHQPTTWN